MLFNEQIYVTFFQDFYANEKMQNLIVKNFFNHCQKVSTFLFSSAIPYLNTLFVSFS